MFKSIKHNVQVFLDAVHDLVDEVIAIRESLDRLHSSIDELKEIGNEMILPDKTNAPTDDINAIYKTKIGLVSFKKARRAMRDE